jgi:TonB family protein
MQSIKAIVTGIFILAGVLVSAQESYASTSGQRPYSSRGSSSTSLPDINRQVSFPGGTKAIHEFLATHFELPALAAENGFEGTVIIICTIDAKGRPSDVKVKQSVHRIVDDAAVAVVRQMPLWQPACVNGVAVSRSIEIPFVIKLR